MLALPLTTIIVSYLNTNTYRCWLRCDRRSYQLLTALIPLRALFYHSHNVHDPLLTREDYLHALATLSWSAFTEKGEVTTVPIIDRSWYAQTKASLTITFCLDIFGRFYQEKTLLAHHIIDVLVIHVKKDFHIVLLNREGCLIVDNEVLQRDVYKIRRGCERVLYSTSAGLWYSLCLRTCHVEVCVDRRHAPVQDVMTYLPSNRESVETEYLLLHNRELYSRVGIKESFELDSVKKMLSCSYGLFVFLDNPGQTVSYTFPNMRFGDRVIFCKVVDFCLSQLHCCALTDSGNIYCVHPYRTNEGYRTLFNTSPGLYREIKIRYIDVSTMIVLLR